MHRSVEFDTAPKSTVIWFQFYGSKNMSLECNYKIVHRNDKKLHVNVLHLNLFKKLYPIQQKTLTNIERNCKPVFSNYYALILEKYTQTL